MDRWVQNEEIEMVVVVADGWVEREEEEDDGRGVRCGEGETTINGVM